ncbi:xylose isomerase [Jeotgalibacillus campisalis]|uniref:Xylose isomerase n=1 Tax=Jeotgalibacillus campisalis TaxID=220754 RepID=A0A0C2VJT7_9BACL|nr:xylose isomerase [Jeotgalibacillus campisalis]
MAYFSNVKQIDFEGAQSTNPFAFKFYNPEETFQGKTMEEYLRFGVAYWHTFTMDGSDPFGAGTMSRQWDRYSGMDLAVLELPA